MLKLEGRGLSKGIACGTAVVSQMPLNVVAAFGKPGNLLRPGVIRDRRHELNGRNTAGHILVIPACVGSTYAGIFLMVLIKMKMGPIAIIVREVEPLLASGLALAEIWTGRSIPVIECQDPDPCVTIPDGAHVRVDGSTGLISFERPDPVRLEQRMPNPRSVIS